MGKVKNLAPIAADKNLLQSKVDSPASQVKPPSELNKAATTQKKQQADPYAGIDPLILAYYWIFTSVQIARDTAQLQAKEIQANAANQNSLIFKEAQKNFFTLSWSKLHTPNGGAKTVDQGDLNNMEAQNQEVSALRGVLGDQLNMLRQNAQVSETNLNTTVSDSQQTIQQGASLMQMLVSLTNQITRI